MGPSNGGVNEPVFSRVFWGPEEINNFEVPGLVKKQIGFTKFVNLLNTLVVKKHVFEMCAYRLLVDSLIFE